MDWDKAKRRGLARPIERDRRKQRDQRQKVLVDFVAKHELSCFKCGSREGPWAKTGISKSRPWAICTACVRSTT